MVEGKLPQNLWGHAFPSHHIAFRGGIGRSQGVDKGEAIVGVWHRLSEYRRFLPLSEWAGA